MMKASLQAIRGWMPFIEGEFMRFMIRIHGMMLRTESMQIRQKHVVCSDALN